LKSPWKCLQKESIAREAKSIHLREANRSLLKQRVALVAAGRKVKMPTANQSISGNTEDIGGGKSGLMMKSLPRAVKENL
jgi:hypothetical protein